MTEISHHSLEEFYVIGLSVRTSNAEEMSPSTAKIPALWEEFFADGIMTQIPNIIDRENIYGVYSDYSFDTQDDPHNIHYHVTAALRVSSLEHIPDGLKGLTIPAQKYAAFQSPSGPLEDIMVQTWQKIWHSKSEEMGGQRAFQKDFELYRESDIADPAHAKASIYIGLKNKKLS